MENLTRPTNSKEIESVIKNFLTKVQDQVA